MQGAAGDRGRPGVGVCTAEGDRAGMGFGQIVRATDHSADGATLAGPRADIRIASQGDVACQGAVDHPDCANTA